MNRKKTKFITPAAVFIMAFALLISLGGCGKRKEDVKTDSSKTPISPMEEISLPQKKMGDGWREAEKGGELSAFSYYAAENDNFLLCMKENGEVGVWDKKSNYLYTTNPADMEEDQIAKAINKMNLGSQAYVEFIDQNGATGLANTLSGAANKDMISYEPVQDGVKFWYYFDKYDVMISLIYILEEDGLRVQFPFEDIKERIGYGAMAEDKNTVSYWGVMGVSILPYFGAAGLLDEGYMLIPDGSGALIYHNNNKAGYDSYKQDVYAREPALHMERTTQVGESVRMPVFGTKSGNNGVLGVIISGEASATINATTSGVLTSYNTVYPKFTYRQSATAVTPVSNSYGNDGTLGASVITNVFSSEKEFEIKYFLLQKEDLNYVDFAKCYRNYLIDHKGLIKNTAKLSSPLFLNLYGGLEVEKYVLGFKTHPVEALTTYNQAKIILEELLNEGVDQIVFKYTGWQKDGMESKVVSKPSFEKDLGGYKDYKELAEFINNNPIEFFPDFDFANFYKNGRGYSLFNDSVQLIQQAPAYQYFYTLHTLGKRDDMRWRLLTPKKVQDAYEKISKDYDKMLTDNISLSTLGNMVYSDFSAKSNGIHRDDARVIWSDILKDAKVSFRNVMVDGGNAYAAVHATHIFGVPTTSTHYDMADESIPFYQIVFHGYSSYSTNPINLSADPQKEMLKALETGSSLGYSLMYGDALTLLETKYNFLYSADYRVWLTTIVSQYKQAAPVLEQIQNKVITSHSMVSDDVYKTTYEDGSIVYVNYRKEAITVEGHQIDGKDFAFIAGGK